MRYAEAHEVGATPCPTPQPICCSSDEDSLGEILDSPGESHLNSNQYSISKHGEEK